MEKKPHLPIDQMDFFMDFQAVADWCWICVRTMTPFHQWTFGKQLVTAADAVCANLIEGGNRYTDPDQLHFFVIARASAQETIFWIRRAVLEEAISRDQGRANIKELTSACKRLNSLITFRRGNSLKVREVSVNYEMPELEGIQCPAPSA